MFSLFNASCPQYSGSCCCAVWLKFRVNKTLDFFFKKKPVWVHKITANNFLIYSIIPSNFLLCALEKHKEGLSPYQVIISLIISFIFFSLCLLFSVASTVFSPTLQKVPALYTLPFSCSHRPPYCTVSILPRALFLAPYLLSTNHLPSATCKTTRFLSTYTM